MDLQELLKVDEENLLADIQPDVIAEHDGNILHELQQHRSQVHSFCEADVWSPQLQHLLVGVLAVHRLRLRDISRREEVLFLELVEGNGQRVRAHNGQCFFYSEAGHWAVYNGVIPQGTLARCKLFLMQLEGFYICLPDQVTRSHFYMRRPTCCEGMATMQEPCCTPLPLQLSPARREDVAAKDRKRMRRALPA